MAEPIKITNEQIVYALKEYCIKTYDVLSANITLITKENNPDDVTCFVTFVGGNTVFSAKEIKDIILNKINANVDSIKFALDDNNEPILLLGNPVRRMKGK